MYSIQSFIRIQSDLGTYTALPENAGKWHWTVSQWWLRKLLHCSLVSSPRFGETCFLHLRGKISSLEN